jgi:competence ComEA-like helix-hairpin-helix protein
MNTRFAFLGVLVCVSMLAAAEGKSPAGLEGTPDPKTGLIRYAGCKLDPAEWADGDSFRVVFPGGQKEVIRLYGVDCFETDAKDESLARRLREQRAHFGVQGIGDAVTVGLEAKRQTEKWLDEPFAVYTEWAVARGRSGLPRFYGFVITASDKDLAAELVASGLGRAHGVYRQSPDGVRRNVYEARLQGLEQAAALNRIGAWKLADPTRLPAQREEDANEREKHEGEKLEAANAASQYLKDNPINPNTASPERMTELPGIGEKTANAIVEERARGDFRNADDMARVVGIAQKTVETIRPYLTFSATHDGSESIPPDKH